MKSQGVWQHAKVLYCWLTHLRVEAQTLANAQLADSQGLEIIPVINKVDLPSADVDRVSKQIEDMLAIPAEEAILASGKSGIGVDDILEAVVERLPPPRWADYSAPRALVLIISLILSKESFAMCVFFWLIQ